MNPIPITTTTEIRNPSLPVSREKTWGLCLRVSVAVFVVLAVCAGCIVQSIHPFYTREARIALPQIVGGWTLIKSFGEDVSGRAIKPWEFSESGELG